uniref:Uncharacterized protein n=1 Tax=Opuntia streptacantha TaxID=393608 RepID=A0A7C9A140_OPUST
MVTRARARVMRSGVQSIVVVARMGHLPLVSLLSTRRCLNRLVQGRIAMRMMMQQAPLLVLVLIIPSHFAPLLPVKNHQGMQLQLHLVLLLIHQVELGLTRWARALHQVGQAR